jgi:hypothetical protein
MNGGDVLNQKLCECGCGEPSGVYPKSNVTLGQVKGEPRRFVPHHHQRMANHHKWNGGRSMADGYVETRAVGHARSSKRGYVKEHILKAEQALGHALPDVAVVHHADENRAHNENRNLVICQDQAYHLLLHQRKRAYEATGNPNAVKCHHCETWGMTGEGEMRTKKSGRSYHLSCNALYELGRRKA